MNAAERTIRRKTPMKRMLFVAWMLGLVVPAHAQTPAAAPEPARTSITILPPGRSARQTDFKYVSTG